MTIFTVGHSTRTREDLVAALRARGILQLADIRTVPRSRRNPQFTREDLALTLPEQGIAYRHFPALGGLRHPRDASENAGWRNESFRGYADYMSTEEFRSGLQDLVAWAVSAPTAIMCAEAVWWRCHRRLVADALTVRGVEVLHITGPGEPSRHELTPFARVDGDRISYPP